MTEANLTRLDIARQLRQAANLVENDKLPSEILAQYVKPISHTREHIQKLEDVEKARVAQLYEHLGQLALQEKKARKQKELAAKREQLEQEYGIKVSAVMENGCNKSI